MVQRKIEVCFTPAVYKHFHNDEAIVVVIDILRATSAICAAFMNGARRIIPVATLGEAQAYKTKGYLVAAERDGLVRDFADFGNSPFNFTAERVKGNEIVYSTTNGTNTIMMAKNSYRVLIGSYLNHTAVVNHLLKEKRDVILLCAGWKDKFNLEDTLYAGALAESVLKDKTYHTECDSTYASVDLWNVARKDLLAYVEKAAQRHRLKKNRLDDVLEYCHTMDLTTIIPYLQENCIIPL